MDRLTDAQHRAMHQAIRQFFIWLTGQFNLQPLTVHDRCQFAPPSDGDWFMRVPDDASEPVTFNSALLSLCGFEYFRTIVLHECFHLFIQGIPNKFDAKQVKDAFSDPLMTHFDIEADFYTHLFLKQVLQLNIEETLSHQYRGASVFLDPRIRTVKLERFVGSTLSYVNAHRNGDRYSTFLPSMTNIPDKPKILGPSSELGISRLPFF